MRALARLAGWMDDRLGNENADRQTICEDVAAQLRDMAAAVRVSAPPVGMSGPLADVTGHLEDHAGVLGVALELWTTRDDSKPQPEVRQAANTAMDAIDAMLAELHRARQPLVTEIRQSDDAAAARADALLAMLRHQRMGGRP
jgi:Asp-tRNA(Asn)/Glu-tRNA(Gln) amidotransferase A subunit family amidase